MNRMKNDSIKARQIHQSLVQNEALERERIMALVKEYDKDNIDYYHTLKRARQLEQNRLNVLKALKYALKSTGLDKFQLEKCRSIVKLVPGKQKAVIDAKNAIPSNYVSLRSQMIFDIFKIENDLKQGKTIPGVHLESTDTVDINIEQEMR